MRALSARVVWPDEIKAFRGPDAWAMEITLPVVQANADAAAVKTAVDLFQGIVKDYAGLAQPEARQLAVTASRLLIAAPLSQKHPAWSDATAAHAALLDAYARFLFQENLKTGNSEQNAKLSDAQKEFLDTLARLLAGDAARAGAALNDVREHVKPWIDGGHWAVAEEVYATLAKALPQSDRRQADLAVVDLWIQQVLREHQRLVAAGLTVPRELDPTLKKALVQVL